MASDGSPVKVYIYDISCGMARAMSQGILGRQIDGIWHTGIVVYGQEYFFGGTGGIEACAPGGTVLGQPGQIVDLGKTEIPFDVFMDFLAELGQTTFRPEKYHLFHHNCNTFSSELAQFLTGNDIPKHITSLPQDVLSTPFGAMIQPFVESLHVQGGHSPFQPSANNPRHQSIHWMPRSIHWMPRTNERLKFFPLYLGDMKNLNGIKLGGQ